jgi:hypothetical protein
VQDRVAKTKTEKSAWKLVDRFVNAVPWTAFVVVMRSPDTGYEIVPVTAFHPIDREICANVVRDFATKKLIND